MDLYARAGISDRNSGLAEQFLLENLIARGKLDEARPLAAARLERLRIAAEKPDADATALNGYAWALLTIEPADLRDSAAALAIAQEAVEKGDGKDPNILDTLAKAWFDTGDAAKAVETQERAIGVLPPSDSARHTSYGATLAAYRAATTQPSAVEPGKDEQP